jgi:hypothetical protein
MTNEMRRRLAEIRQEQGEVAGLSERLHELVQMVAVEAGDPLGDIGSLLDLVVFSIVTALIPATKLLIQMSNEAGDLSPDLNQNLSLFGEASIVFAEAWMGQHIERCKSCRQILENIEAKVH